MKTVAGTEQIDRAARVLPVSDATTMCDYRPGGIHDPLDETHCGLFAEFTVHASHGAEPPHHACEGHLAHACRDLTDDPEDEDEEAPCLTCGQTTTGLFCPDCAQPAEAAAAEAAL